MFRNICLAAALSAGTCTVSFAQLSGKVTLVGNPPEMKQVSGIAAVPQCAQLHKDPVFEETVIVGDKGELANVIVFIKEAKPGDLKGPALTTPAKLNQKGCMYSPHVLAVELGQPVLVINSDPFLHNVHCDAKANKPFNFVQVTVGQNQLEPFKAEETLQIKCDVHPWMRTIVRVFDHPYFAVTGEEGKFTIDTKAIKDGSYLVCAWHELFGDSEPQTVEIKGGKATSAINFTYQATKPTVRAAGLPDSHLASNAGKSVQR